MMKVKEVSKFLWQNRDGDINLSKVDSDYFKGYYYKKYEEEGVRLELEICLTDKDKVNLVQKMKEKISKVKGKLNERFK